MFAIVSGEVRTTSSLPEAASPPTPRIMSIGAALRHGLVVGVAVTVTQLLLVVVLLYLSGIVEL